MNGNKWLILTVTVIYIGFFSVMGHAWNGVVENRKDIIRMKDCVVDKLEAIRKDISKTQVDVAYIKAKLEQ